MAKRGNTKELILEAGVDLFAEKGYQGTSVRDLAARVGIRESSLYNHFPGKEAILEGILEYYLKGIGEAMLSDGEMEAFASSEQDPVRLWLKGSAYYSARLPRLSEKINRIIHNEMYLDEKCRRFFLHHILSVQKSLTEYLLKDLVDRGMIRDSPLALTAERYVHMLHGLSQENTLIMMESGDGEAVRRKTEEHIASFIEGLK